MKVELSKYVIDAIADAVVKKMQEPTDDATLKDIFCMGCEYKEQEPCEDCISKQAVIDACDQSINLFEAVDRIKELSSVTPKPKTGYWFIDERPESDRETICSNCEQPIFKYHKLDFDYRPNYCPNCGAKMIEPQESEG